MKEGRKKLVYCMWIAHLNVRIHCECMAWRKKLNEKRQLNFCLLLISCGQMLQVFLSLVGAESYKGN